MHQLQNINYLFQPSKNPNAPIIILIHGYGSNEEDLFSFAPDLSGFNVVSVQGVRNTPMGGYAWYDLNIIGGKMQSNQEQAEEAIVQLSNFIDAIQKEIETENNNIWLCGFSQGAILSYALTLNYPNKIKRTICLSGFPDTRLWNDSVKENDYSEIKMFVSHGVNDMVIPIERAQLAKTYLIDLNIDFVYHEYQSGHGLNPQNYQDLMNWIKKHHSKY